jgi:hypothetical protein
MSDLQQQLLNTDQALNLIFQELKDLQDASAQIDKAKDTSQRVIQSNEEINLKMIELLRGAEAFLKYIEQNHIPEELSEIKGQNQDVQKILSGLTEIIDKNNQVYGRSFERITETQKEIRNQVTVLENDLTTRLNAYAGARRTVKPE